MAQDENEFVTSRPRQYRPTYSHIPSASSMQDIASKPLPVIPQADIPHLRRQSAFFSSENLRSTPTVASSGLTASASTNDISAQAQVPFFDRLTSRVTPTRIPSPTSRKSSKLQHTLSPIKSDSENEPCDHSSDSDEETPLAVRKVSNSSTASGLLGRIHSGQSENSMTRSRTMSVLTNLTNSFSRSNLHRSRSSLQSLSANQLNAQAPVATVDEIDIHHIRCSMPPPYWAGRYQTLFDQTKSRVLEPEYLNSPLVIRQLTENYKSRSMDEYFGVEDAFIARRVFTQLEEMCLTNDAKKSFRNFQQAYARQVKKEALLPIGGSMADKENVFSKFAGRMFSASKMGLHEVVPTINKPKKKINAAAQVRAQMATRREMEAQQVLQHLQDLQEFNSLRVVEDSGPTW
jgi:hypothetical protein